MKTQVFSRQQQKIQIKDMSNNPNNSIDELLEIFKYYRSQAKSNQPQSFNLFDSPLQTGRNRADITHDHFSFSKQLPQLQYGTHSSLQKVNKFPQRMSSTRRKSNYCNLAHDSIFNRLYEENKKIRQKRQRLFQQGRRSLEKQQTKQCTFIPNTKSTKVKTQRSFNADDCEGFYIKNMEWQNRREVSIKKQQCERNSEERKELTFAPKIVESVLSQNPYRKKGTENKENQFITTKKKADSYLHNYHKINHKELGETSARTQNTGTFHLRQGYFSYIN